MIFKRIRFLLEQIPGRVIYWVPTDYVSFVMEYSAYFMCDESNDKSFNSIVFII